MMSIEIYAAYLLACIALTIVPGPTVTLIIANSLTHGSRSGLLNVTGTQIGLGLMMLVLIVGLSSVVEAMGFWFNWLRLAGAAYLIWLGWRLLRAGPRASAETRPARPRGGFVLQGLLVMLSNPKALLFFGAFIPQFVDPAASAAGQIALLGVTAMVVAAMTDSFYAVMVGRVGTVISERRIRLASRVSGCFMIGGGVWLAAARAR